MERPEEVRCATCVYWEHFGDSSGQCRRYAPSRTFGGSLDWAVVMVSSWCGEWSGSWLVKEQLDQDPRLPPKVDDVVY